jgi:phosphoserine phosphatase RsbU/P
MDTVNQSIISPTEKTILVIDDDESVRILLQSCLQNDYRVITASNGEEGLILAEQIIPAIIICDWMMPGGMDGIEVCSKVRENNDLKLSYFILLTALGNTDERVLALETGADDFIQKPPNIRELKARVRVGARIHELSYALSQKQKETDFGLNQARDYLLSLLPDALHYRSGNFQIALDWYYKPSALLAGDIFHYQKLDEKHLAVYLLDVAGHGIGAALLSVSILNMLRTGMLSANPLSPSAVMRALNNTFPMEKQNHLFFTMWYGILHLDTGDLTYSSAGHPPAILQFRNSDEFIPLKTKGIPVGMILGFPYEEASVHIKEDAYLTIYSDGMYESVNNPAESDLENWIKIVKDQPWKSHGDPLKHTIQYLVESSERINGSTEFEDDMSLIQVFIKRSDVSDNNIN